MENQTPQVSRSARNRKVSLKKVGKILLMIVVISIPILVISRFFKKSNSETSAKSSANVAGVSTEGVTASMPINMSVPIPVKDGKGVEAGVLTMTIPSAEKRNEIVVKGKRATAIDGRDFLLLNLKIDNPMDKGIQINTRDFFRLNSNSTGEWLAPEIHNDPVEVQAISTKITRVGFPINEADQNLILQIGQIDGEKQQVPLNF